MSNIVSSQKPNPDASPLETNPAPHPSTLQRSVLERFFMNFFREENIKWMAVIGAAIVLASSIMLVTREWQNWSNEIKYLTILGYTAITYVLSGMACHKFGLKTVGRVLQLLTLLLLPLCFQALGGHAFRIMTELGLVTRLILFLPSLALAYIASTKILDELLRGRQGSFVTSYLILACAGFLPVITHPWIAAVFIAVMWGVATIGTIKVNRHIFWLAEEGVQPRIFAFLPIATVLSLFVALVVTKTGHAIDTPWLGMVCVMVSATILLAARTVANVFRQRTGDLVRPLPWNLMAPLVVGLVVLTLGVLLSCHGFSFTGASTIALLPTAFAAAVLLGVVAWDTRVHGFAWGSLALLAVTYQTAPVLFRGLVQLLKENAAAVVQESTLPIAFYGITYLPFVIALIVVSAIASRCTRRSVERWTVFALPTRRMAIGLTVLLFVLACTNLKALTVVSLLDIPLLLLMARVFRERLFAVAALGNLVLCSILCVPFLVAMKVPALVESDMLLTMSGLSIVLSMLSVFDRWMIRIPTQHKWLTVTHADGSEDSPAFCSVVGCLLAILVAVGWMFATGAGLPGVGMHQRVQLIFVIASLLATNWRMPNYVVGLFMWLSVFCAFGFELSSQSFAVERVLVDVSLMTAAVSMLMPLVIRFLRYQFPSWNWNADRVTNPDFYLRTIQSDALRIESKPGTRGWAQLLSATVVPLGDLSLVTTLCLVSIVQIPLLFISNFAPQDALQLQTGLLIAWGLCIARMYSVYAGGFIVGLLFSLWCTSTLFYLKPELHTVGYAFATWTAAASLTSFALWFRKNSAWNGLRDMSALILVAMSLVSLLNGDELYRWMGLGIAGVACVHNLHHRDRRFSMLLATYFNLQCAMLVFYFNGMHGPCISWLADSRLPVAVASQLPLIALSMLIFDVRRLPLDSGDRRAWAQSLRSIALVTAGTALMYGSVVMPVAPWLIAGGVLWGFVEFVQASRYQKEEFVWLGLFILAGTAAWCLRVEMISVGAGVCQILLIGSAVVGLSLGHILRGKPRLGVFAAPLSTVGLAAPGVLTAMAIFHQFASPHAAIDPMGSLSMFGAAAIYFHHGMRTKDRNYLLMSLFILNTCLIILWRSLSIHDAQVYCIPIGLSLITFVRLLKKEIPQSSQEPLLYAGTLTILVSPLYAILGGSWIHLITLLALCVLIVLLAIGMRLRALLYCGTGFLLADLVMMVIRSSVENPNLLWMFGLGIGAAVIALAAFCERHRERVLTRIRYLSAELATWN